MKSIYEIEYKYDASHITLKQFHELMLTKSYEDYFSVSSWDIYYTSTNSDKFIRFRDSPKCPELTSKEKTEKDNNWTRIEIDVPLLKSKNLALQVHNLLVLNDYKENFRIFKSCYCYKHKDLSYVYYVVFNENLKELGRFLEIELDKKSNASIMLLEHAEKELITLKLSKKDRLSKSLYEMYKK